jgi:hypothetical protein
VSYPTGGDQPQIFLSFAGEDREKARDLAERLRAYQIRSFVDLDSIELGANVVLAISNALTRSDYYVLLWSRHTAGRAWVDEEWATALHLEVTRRRGFVFVVRLDRSDLPAMLRPRRFVDATGGWDAVADCLARTWKRDRGLGIPVLPAPLPDTAVDAGLPDLMELHLRNRTIPVAHVLPLPRVATGVDLHDNAIDALALPSTVAPLAGIVDTRFRYRFEIAGRPILDGKLVDQNVQDGDLVDLLVTVEVLGRGEIITTWTLRGQPAGTAGAADPRLPAGLTRAAFDAHVARCFKHLEPW